MPNFSDLYGGGGIKSVQRGIVTPASATSAQSVTVRAVNPSKAILFVSLMGTPWGQATAYPASTGVGGKLVNATTISVVGWIQNSGPAPAPAEVAWQLVEFN